MANEITVEVVKEFLTTNKEDEGVIAFLAEITPEAKLTAEAVLPFLETQEGKALVDPIVDRAVTGGVKTYKEGNYEKDLQAATAAGVAKEMLLLNPEETLQDKRIRELENAVEDQKKKGDKNILTRELTEESVRLGIKPVFIEEYTGGTREEGFVYLRKVKAELEEGISIGVNAKLSAGFKPGASGTGDKNKIDVSKLSVEEVIRMEEAGELDAALVDE